MRSVIVFAGARYDAPLWTNRQQVASHLARRGWKVLYVEPRLLLAKRLSDAAWLRRLVLPWPATENLSVLAQANLLGGSRRLPGIGVFNHRALNGWRVQGVARRLGLLKDPAILLYDTEAAEFLDDFPRSRVVYDCVDDHRAEPGANSALVEREEAAILARASAIAVTVPALLERFRARHPKVQLVPNAADVDAFTAKGEPDPPDLARIPRPRIGTIGALDSYKLDLPLLRELARANPSWHFAFVGPVEYAGRKGERGIAELRGLPNIHLLGPKPRGAVPAYVHGFDVAIIPYRESAYNRASFPLKFWEFCAAGVPVVASGLPSLAQYAHLATLAEGPDAFAEGIAQALRESEMARAARRADARRHDYAARVDVLEKLLTS